MAGSGLTLRTAYGESAQLLIIPSSSQTLHHHRIGADASAGAMAMVHPPGAASMGQSAPTRQCRHPRITDLAGGAGPDNVAQVLREALRGPRRCVGMSRK